MPQYIILPPWFFMASLALGFVSIYYGAMVASKAYEPNIRIDSPIPMLFLGGGVGIFVFATAGLLLPLVSHVYSLCVV